MGANAVNLVRIMEGRDQPRALGAARRTRLGSSPYRRGARRPVLQSKTCLMSLGSWRSPQRVCASVTHHLPLYTSIECVLSAGVATIVRRGLLIETSLQLTIHEKALRATSYALRTTRELYQLSNSTNQVPGQLWLLGELDSLCVRRMALARA